MERAQQAVRVLGHVRLLTWPLPNERAHGGFRRILASALALLTLSASTALAQITAEKIATAAPDGPAAPVKSLLSADGIKAVAGGATLEFWWVTMLPSSGSGPAGWGHVAEGALVGIVRVSGPFKEIRGKTVKPGVYTLRYALQPQNGDHLGASSFREHLLLSPVAADTDARPLGFEGTVAISKQTVGASHPAALSLDPPVSTASLLSTYTNELDHKGLTLAVQTSGGPLKFGLILIGTIEH